MPSSTSQRRVVIVDDSRTVQAMLDHAFSKRTDFLVVGFANDARTAVDMVRRLTPEMVTIDLCMPYLDGAALLEMLSDLPNLCKIIVSDNSVSNIRLTAKLIELGASACIAKRDLTDPVGFFNKINAAANRVKANNKVTCLQPNSRSCKVLNATASIVDLRPNLPFPVPADEVSRIEFLKKRALANAQRERRFDLITRHIAKCTEFPACLLTIIDRDTQWIKSAYGVEVESTPRHQAFCNYTISQGGVFAVSDAAADSRFCTNPAVTGVPNVRSYVGHPVFNAEGVAIASLCVMDIRARSLSNQLIDQLTGLAEIVGEMIDPRTARAA